MAGEIPPESKLVSTKRRWAREGRLPAGEPADRERPRLPPGQRAVRDWPVLDLGSQPDITARRFRLTITGAVRRPLALDLAGFMALPQHDSQSDMHCVTGWSRFANRWQGVAARTLLALVEPLERARHVIVHGHDGYSANLRLDQFAQPDVLLVHAWQGAPIARRHGGPVRLLVPRLYLWKSVKWPQRIELSARDRPGFWEREGYHNNGDPWREQRYG